MGTLNHLLPEQERAAKEIKSVLDKYKVCLFFGQVRSGKSRSFLQACRGFNNVLVVTKKDAIGGVLSEMSEIGITGVEVINYHSVTKCARSRYDLVIFDESHLYISNSSPKTSKIWKDCKKICKGSLIIFCSGTPTAEGYGKLYHKLALSDHTPFIKYKKFADWFNDYGIKQQIRVNGNTINTYKKCKDSLIKEAVSHLIVTLTTKDTGHMFEAEDIIHNIPMSRRQQRMYYLLDRDQFIKLPQGLLLADTPVKLLSKKHQIAGGIGVKLEDNCSYTFKNCRKCSYILKEFEVHRTIILANYITEQSFLASIFPHVGSVTKLSSGVDLSNFNTMVIYSMSFSAANYFQVRARMMNVNRKTPIKVHYLHSGIDKYVYEAVSSKQNFTSSWFRNNLN